MFEGLIKMLLKIINNHPRLPNSFQFQSVGDAIRTSLFFKHLSLRGRPFVYLETFFSTFRGFWKVIPFASFLSRGFLFLPELVHAADRPANALPVTLESRWEKIVVSYRKLKNSCNTNPLLKVNLWYPSIPPTLKSGQAEF